VSEGARSDAVEDPQEAPARRETLLERLRLDKWDVRALVALTAVAFVFRFFSPLLPDFFAHPFSGAPLTNCVSHTPINPRGDLGTLCGLAYPFNRGYPDQNGVLSPPNGQVFDEVYFPVDAYNDIKGIQSCKSTTVNCKYNYFDPEPPLAKLMIAAGELGYGWYRVNFEGATGSYIDLGFNTFGWRIAACIFGVLCVPMMYLFARRLWANRFFAIAAATLVCFDGMFFIQSRIGMIDIFPIFLILLAYYVFLVHIQSRTPRSSLTTLLLLGIVLGVGIASKWIVLGAYASIVFLLVARAVRRQVDVHVGPSARPIWSWGRGEGPAIAGGAPWHVYVVVAVIAMALIPVAIYVASWYPFFARGQFQSLADLINYQREAYVYHATLTATHPYGSPWWSWPLLSRPVLYYAQYTGLGVDQYTGQPLVAHMADLGNPWIWWTSLPCLLSLPYFIIRYKSFPATLILIGFITQYLPWAPISRVLFMYHMFGGLVFMVLALAFVLGWIAERWPDPGRSLAIAHLVLASAFFLYFYPVWTAVPISNPAYYAVVTTNGVSQLAPGTPLWGPKLWLVDCIPNLPAAKPQLWCWN
jgi:dolichyl-phosphate-mannose-protein mannosyltransferase